jgi:acetyl esterase/lipase
MVDEEGNLLPENQVDKNSPPTFLVHAFNDFVPMRNCLGLMNGLTQANVPSELHVFDAGRHGYGLRSDKTKPVTNWPKLCEQWLNRNQFFKKAE